MPSVSTDRLNGLTASVAIKAPVVCATTANITLSGTQSLDGITVATGDRVLVKDQTDGTANGIYEANTSAWTRAADWNGARDVVSGTRVFVTQGSTNGGREFYVSTTGVITVGTTSIAMAALTVSGANTFQFVERDPIIATAGQTTFTAAYVVGAVLVFINGAMVPADDYTATNGTSIVFNEGLSVGDVVVPLTISITA